MDRPDEEVSLAHPLSCVCLIMLFYVTLKLCLLYVLFVVVSLLCVLV